MYAIIACGIFQKEIQALRGELGFPFEVHYLASGLHVDFDDIKAALADPVIFDSRNLYEPELVARHGLTYVSIGRPMPGH